MRASTRRPSKPTSAAGRQRRPVAQRLDLGPTTPARAALAAELQKRFDLHFHTLVHGTAYVSPLAKLGDGVFVGANSVIGPRCDVGWPARQGVFGARSPPTCVARSTAC